MSDAVLYQQEGGVVTLTLNEPETRNAISAAIVDALVGYVEKINADLTVGCVILTGAGEGFSSGGNVKNMKDRAGLFAGSPAEIRRGYHSGIQRIPMALYGLEAPSIAAVNGAAVGAGCDLSTMCDIRVAGRSAKFAESFLRVGLVSGDGGAWFLPKAVGMSKAYEMTKLYETSRGTQGLPVLRLGDLLRVPRFALHEFVTTGRIVQLIPPVEHATDYATPTKKQPRSRRSNDRAQLSLLGSD